MPKCSLTIHTVHSLLFCLRTSISFYLLSLLKLKWNRGTWYFCNLTLVRKVITNLIQQLCLVLIVSQRLFWKTVSLYFIHVGWTVSEGNYFSKLLDGLISGLAQGLSKGKNFCAMHTIPNELKTPFFLVENISVPIY